LTAGCYTKNLAIALNDLLKSGGCSPPALAGSYAAGKLLRKTYVFTFLKP